LKVVLAGFGAVGRRVAQHLVSEKIVESLLVVHRDPRRVEAEARELGDKVELVELVERRQGNGNGVPAGDVTVLAAPTGSRRVAESAIAQGSHVVSCVDDPSEVKALLSSDKLARSLNRSIVAGVAMAPGLSCVLAAHVRQKFDSVEEIHVASVGTGGPACAREHHAALSSLSLDWEDGEWRRRPGGSGRELVWFPEPVGGADCYRAALADALLLLPAFPGCRRITSRLKATRRDRMTAWLPMLRPPHPEGLVGAVRVEMRGWVDGQAETAIFGSAVAPASAAAVVASRTAVWAGEGRLARPGAGGMAEMITDPALFLKEVGELGVHVSVFEGQPAPG
jgi:saccharopine dehydrogenase-like NADP-dependent oxidoreductase